MTREEFKEKAKEVVDNEPFGNLGVLFDYESFVEMRVAYIPDGLGSADADMPLDEFLDKLYEKIKNMTLEPCVSDGVCEHDKMQMLENLRTEINSLHNGCGLFNDGVDATLKLIDKYRNGEQK